MSNPAETVLTMIKTATARRIMANYLPEPGYAPCFVLIAEALTGHGNDAEIDLGVIEGAHQELRDLTNRAMGVEMFVGGDVGAESRDFRVAVSALNEIIWEGVNKGDAAAGMAAIREYLADLMAD
ncbi:hypothetical protein [Paracoccus sp. (in: a-proteobacteria)]|uniref:hypothetical protein n=1 Tax=Paracoccus sp. TaxID=267 RepID=UPI0026DECF81|nr:hypothetical protein [Paracoccus sp. (in: a-proteobacteria)]MDO5648920.1 hypothetical protein [Paracoccus sp. (in: a-proteobacteria)]